jgi:hypothetical protein
MKKYLLLPLCFLPFLSGAHAINYDMESRAGSDVFSFYTGLGFTHILPYGYDHLLFILGILLVNPQLRSMMMQATLFTVAHSVTLILTANDTIVPVPSIIEPIIALSILFVAIENLYMKRTSGLRYLLIFLFGLIHGMGFAGALDETGLPRDSFYTALLAFNFGVELGQVAFILILFLTIGYFRKQHWYRKKVVIPLSVCIGLIAAWWSFERIITV